MIPLEARNLPDKSFQTETIYETGLKITAEEKAHINLQPHRVFPEGNYTLRPHDLTNKK